MKKVLFAGVAAVAFGAAAVAQAADPLTLSIGGDATEWAGYVQNQHSANFGAANNFTTGVSAANATQNFSQQDAVNLNFTGKTKLDNGITVGVEIDTNGSQANNTHSYDTGNSSITRDFVSVSGVFGVVEAGQQDNVGALIHNGSPDVGGIGGQDGNFGFWVLAPEHFNENWQRTYVGDDRSGNKVIYVTPTYYGLSAGVSYTPDMNFRDYTHGYEQTAFSNPYSGINGGQNTSVGASGGAANAGGNLWVYGLSYNNTFDGVGVKADVGSGKAAIAGMTAYQGGLNVSYKGFTVGGSALKRMVGEADKGLAAAARAGLSWDGGVSYVTGPYGVSLTYFVGQAATGVVNNGGTATVDTGTNNGVYDRDSVWALSGAYDLGPGVKLTESLIAVKYSTNDGIAADQNKGFAAITGIGVKF